MALKITLDPGHGQYQNKSPNNPAYIEGAQMWKLANKLKAALENYGFEVVTTRPNIEANPSLSDRGSMSGKNGSCMFLSLHSNAPGMSADGTYSKLATGSVVYYSMTRAENKTLADKLGNKVSEIMGHYYRGSKTRQYPDRPGVDYYGVIRGAAQSGCKCAMLIEHGFHTNVADSNFLLDEGNLQTLAEAEAAIIAEYFGQKKKSTPSGHVETYRVRKSWADAKSQIGAYENLTYAKAAADKNPGYSVYNSVGECVYPLVEKAPETEVYTVDSFSVGEIVNFAGGKHYSNANASNGSIVKASLAKVTGKYPSGKHQLCLRAVNNDGKYIGGVYGWVDVNTVTKRTASVTKKSVIELAKEVIDGKWGNGATRKKKLTEGGYDYAAVQKKVNELLS